MTTSIYFDSARKCSQFEAHLFVKSFLDPTISFLSSENVINSWRTQLRFWAKIMLQVWDKKGWCDAQLVMISNVTVPSLKPQTIPIPAEKNEYFKSLVFIYYNACNRILLISTYEPNLMMPQHCFGSVILPYSCLVTLMNKITLTEPNLYWNTLNISTAITWLHFFTYWYP